jgi:hypothetical protein
MSLDRPEASGDTRPHDDRGAPKAGFRELPASVTLLGVVSLLNDIASEMVLPLLPAFLPTVLGGSQL